RATAVDTDDAGDRAEASAATGASAGCYGASEQVGIFAIVVAEDEFVQVERQILARDVVIGAENAALQERPESLNRVGMNDAVHVFVRGMVDHAVPLPEILADVKIGGRFIGCNQADLPADGLSDEAIERGRFSVLNDAAHDVALARDGAHDARL